jgi:hypothetical protein
VTFDCDSVLFFFGKKLLVNTPAGSKLNASILLSAASGSPLESSSASSGISIGKRLASSEDETPADICLVFPDVSPNIDLCSFLFPSA